MRRVALALFSTVSGLVMLLNFKTSGSASSAAPPAVSATGPGTAGGSTAATSTAPSTGTSSAHSSSAAKASTTKTVTGDSINTRWGPVQVSITVTNGKLANVTAVDYPWNNGRDQEINTYAIPALNDEALAAGSANIDMVSGATYTSQGYIGSLQSALDKAGL